MEVINPRPKKEAPNGTKKSNHLCTKSGFKLYKNGKPSTRIAPILMNTKPTLYTSFLIANYTRKPTLDSASAHYHL